MEKSRRKQLRDYVLRVKRDKSDVEAWDYLYLGYRSYILAVIQSIIFDYHSQQDVLQEIWLKLYKNIEKFDESREFENWLGKVAANVCFTWLARNKGGTEKKESAGNNGTSMRNVSYNDQYREDAEESNFTEDFTNSVCDRDAINEALGEIKDKRKVLAFKYKFMDGLPIRTIAEIMDVPESTLHNWIYRIKDRLAPLLKKTD